MPRPARRDEPLSATVCAPRHFLIWGKQLREVQKRRGGEECSNVTDLRPERGTRHRGAEAKERIGQRPQRD